jgi:hypothetical protein
MSDPTISDSGKKTLKEDLDNGVITSEKADQIITQIYQEKQTETPQTQPSPSIETPSGEPGLMERIGQE